VYTILSLFFFVWLTNKSKLYKKFIQKYLLILPNKKYYFMHTTKELENKTSYKYFGARYYDSELSGWLSVDAYSSKYQH
jgi:hypothetical protein